MRIVAGEWRKLSLPTIYSWIIRSIRCGELSSLRECACRNVRNKMFIESLDIINWEIYNERNSRKGSSRLTLELTWKNSDR